MNVSLNIYFMRVTFQLWQVVHLWETKCGC